MYLMSVISGNVALLPKSSSVMSSTRASAERLIMAFVTTPKTQKNSKGLRYTKYVTKP